MTDLSNDDVYQINRLNLFKALAALGVDTVTVGFDGGGDEGQIHDVTATTGTTKVDLEQPLNPPIVMHEVRESFTARYTGVADQDRKIEDRSYNTLSDAVEALCYDLLDRDNAGWGNNAGAYGEFEINVPEQKIELNYNQRFESSEFFGYEY